MIIVVRRSIHGRLNRILEVTSAFISVKLKGAHESGNFVDSVYNQIKSLRADIRFCYESKLMHELNRIV